MLVRKSAVLLAMAVAAALTGCTEDKTADAAGKNRQATVGYVRIEPKPVELRMQLPGRVAASVVSDVRPQVDGILQERRFKEGEYVQKGQVLYKIDDATYQAAVAAAKASLAEAKANLAELVSREKRQRPLVKIRAVSPQDYDQVVSLLNQAKAKVQKSQADLRTAEINLAYTSVKAPVSGWIGVSAVTEGALVTASQATALATIRQVDSVYVDLTQPSIDMLRFQKALANGGINSEDGPKLFLKLEDGSAYSRLADSKPIEGHVLFSETHVNASTGSVLLRAVFSNPDCVLLPGMYATGMLTSGTLNGVLLVPQRAVLMAGDGTHFVFVLKEGEAKESFTVQRRPVKLDRTEGRNWVISSGIEPGDLVVVDGLQKVKAGEKVLAKPFEKLQAQPQSHEGKEV